MLRRLQISDSKYMLEWMHDKDITKCFKKDFMKYSENDVDAFIKKSFSETEQNFAVVDNNNVYQGTISLKNINRNDMNAEFAIVMRKNAQHKGIAYEATKELIKYAFDILGLRKVYLNCLEKNYTAIRFYDKCGFLNEGTLVGQWCIGGEYNNVCLMAMYNMKNNLPENEMLFREQGDDRGHLVVIENNKDIPFEIKRIFYIYGTQKNAIRGSHANRITEFVLVNIMGSCKVRLSDGRSEKIIILDHPHVGLYIPRMYWKEMYDFTPDAVLMVLCSTFFNESEYIRDKQIWLDEIGK